MIPDPSNTEQYLVYLRSYQPNISPQHVEDLKFVIKKGVRPGTTKTESWACPSWKTPGTDVVVDWAPFYSDIGFPAFIYVARYNPLTQSWE